MIDLATIFGFIRNDNGTVAVANRIFEIRLYNYFLTTGEAQNNPIFVAASDFWSQFIHNSRLDMDTVIRRYVELFEYLYGDQQLAEYLDCVHLKKGYMFTYNFNKKNMLE